MFRICLWFYFPLGLIFIYEKCIARLGKWYRSDAWRRVRAFGKSGCDCSIIPTATVCRDLHYRSGSLGKRVDSVDTILLLVYTQKAKE